MTKKISTCALLCAILLSCAALCLAEPKAADEQQIKIGLLFEDRYTTLRIQNFSGAWNCSCLTASGTKTIKNSLTLPEGEDIVVQSTRRGLVVQPSNGKEQKPAKEITLSDGGLLSIEIPKQEPMLIKGQLEIYCEEGKIMLVNAMPLKEALVSIVSNIGVSNETEALKAMIIMMRTRLAYLLKHKAHKNNKFDICNKAHCAPFNGCARDRELVRLLEQETKNQYITYKNELILPRFTVCCGGQLSSAKKVFDKDEPYHKAKYDMLDGKGSDNCFHAPAFHWQCEIQNDEILDFMAVSYAGGAENIYVKWSPSVIDENGRINEVKIYGKMIKTVSGVEFLRDLGEYFGQNSIKSMKLNTDSRRMGVIFRGMGRGEGVGMCLYGADGLAKKKQSCKNILLFYYDGCVITNKK